LKIKTSDGVGIAFFGAGRLGTINQPNGAHIYTYILSNVHDKFRTDPTIDVIPPRGFLERLDVGERSDRDDPLRVHLYGMLATNLGYIG